MKKFDLHRYLKQGRYWIILLSVLAGLGFLFLASKRQTYKARAVIEYDYSIASSGKTPNGKKLDVSEIKSTKVIQPVIERLGLSESVDMIRTNISIEGYVSEDEEALKEALLKEGTEYNNTPTEYVITYTVGSNRSRSYAQDVLDALIGSYISYFGEKYVSESTIPNNASIISNDSYDYLEKTDMLDQHITDVLSFMKHKPSDFLTFRPICANCSFQDIYNTYKYVQDSEIPYLYSDILTYRLSKDVDLLLSDYRQRIESSKIEQEYFSGSAKQMKKVMDTFANKSKQIVSGTSAGGKEEQSVGDSGFAFILDEVYANYDSEENQIVDRTTTYDYLIDRYAKFLINRSELAIDEEYYQYVVDLYSSYDYSLSVSKRRNLEHSVNTRLRRVSDQLNNLYQRLYDGVNEYNNVRGSDNLRLRTSVIVSDGMNIKLYTVLVVIVFFIFVSAAVIVIGRLGDFIEYSLWTNHITNLPNRHRCDQYIEELSSMILPEHFTCLMIKVTNIRIINEKFGRELGNQALLQLANIIKQTAPKDSQYFYNDNETYICFISPCNESRAEHLKEGIVQQMESVNGEHQDLEIEYRICFAESSSEKIFEIHKLISAVFKKL